VSFVFVLLAAIGAVIWTHDAQANPIRTTSVADICGTKTSTVRNVPQKLKRQIYARDGVAYGVRPAECGKERYCYEVDHRISLELGGENAADNLMIQPYFGGCNAHHKDKLENRLHRMICAGEIQVKEAQDLIYNHWIYGYRKYIDAVGCE
jgi:hypothetical protein